MNAMKILSILAIIFGFSQCGSLKLEENPPFTINSATYINWSGGQQGVKGMNLKIEYSSTSKIDFQNVYFADNVAKLEDKSFKKSKIVVGFFSSNEKRDIVLDSNTKKEMNNTLPDNSKIPFELKENEAVITYKINDKIKYFKIDDVKKGKPVFYPSAPKQ
jgi:hypothetical protein